MTVKLTATVESLEQAEKLLQAGVDYLYFGEATFALRLPAYFSRSEQKELVDLAHSYGKQVTVAVNGLMHPEKMTLLPEYLAFLEGIGVDQVVVGDTGVVHVLRRDGYQLPFIYDGQTFVTSAGHIEFWAKRGAIGSVLAREIPYLELVEMSQGLSIFAEVLVYGATCIHQSKRPLLQNYYNFTEVSEAKGQKDGLFISEPRKPETHYSIFEDEHGTHIFANNDLNLGMELNKLTDLGYKHWKLDGLYTPGADFVAISALFAEARTALANGQWDETYAQALNDKITALHPVERGLDTGFFALHPDDVK